MLIKPKFEENVSGVYSFGAKAPAKANDCLSARIFQELWNGFCCNCGELSIENVNENVFILGEGRLIQKPDNGYILEVTEKGVSISASDDKNLLYGFYALLERIRPICTKKDEEEFSIPCCRVVDEPVVKTRMVHFCVFPETKLDFLVKYLRISAFLRYTHVIVEFWGTLQFDCLKELAWKEGYSKQEIKPIFQEARDMGLEIIPMFNCWGHATGSKLNQGKHVVLDQNLALAPLFDESGWNWDLKNPQTKELHKKIFNELIELCGKGEYFHIGCDEAYGKFSKDYYDVVTDYINDLSFDLEKRGRKTIMWGDMLLHKDSIDNKTGNAYQEFVQDKDLQQCLLKKLSKKIIIADWQYQAKNSPIETAVFLKEQGFNVLCCPWDRTYENLIATAKTVKEYELKGVLHTTWHNVAMGMPLVGVSATLAWEQETQRPDKAYYKACFANILRKIHFPNGDYANSGWAESQILDWLF